MASLRTVQSISKRTRSDPSSEYGWSFRRAKSGLFWTFDSETDKEPRAIGFFAGQGGDTGSQRGSWGDIGGAADAYGWLLDTTDAAADSSRAAQSGPRDIK